MPHARTNARRHQDIDPANYPRVYLITSPRFLNYKFSPASFWFLYSADSELLAMIAEVNNTFDERRLYFLPSNLNLSEDLIEGSLSPKSTHRTKYFKHVWPKDFHVSPFNSRKGSYALSARDPSFSHSPAAINPGAKDNEIDIKATLLSSKGHPKMTARLWSIATPLDPTFISFSDMLLFITSWWWVGLMTCK